MTDTSTDWRGFIKLILVAALLFGAGFAIEALLGQKPSSTNKARAASATGSSDGIKQVKSL